MLNDFLLAVAAAFVLGLLGLALAKPRKLLAAKVRSWATRTHRRVFQLERLERLERGMERQAVEQTRLRCREDGNPDDEFESDWYRYYTGDPDADVDYRRKQQRDAERFGLGGFRANG
jgi:hypothetical protein